MKKFTAIALLVVMVLALAACGKKTTEVAEVPTEAPTTVATTAATTAAPTTAAATTEAAHEMDESPKTGVADVIAALPYISGLSLTGLAAVSLTGRKKEN